MKKMPASKFKAQCLAVIDKVNQTGGPVIITKQRKAVAKLIPINRDPDAIFGYMADRFKIVGDIESPVVPPESWNVW